MACNALQHPTLSKASHRIVEKKIAIAFAIGMALNLVSIYIGNPYIISLIMVPVAAVMTFKWLHQPLPWIVLVSVVAANPVNLNAPIALNLIFASFLLMLSMQSLSRLPSWLYPVLFFAFFSIIGSIVDWNTTGEFFTQFAAIGNYVIGPFFLIPLVYFRLLKEFDTCLMVKTFIFSLILPTLIFMLLARIFGTPVIDANSSTFESLVNVSIYHLGNIDIQLTRTQAGIPIAVLICASFAIIVATSSTKIRLIGIISITIAIFLLLVTGSIGSSLAALSGITLLLVVARRYISIKKYLMILPIFFLLALVGWNQVPRGIKDYVASRYDEKLTGGVDTSDRSGRWQLSLDYLMENPLGRGWDLYVAPIGIYPHNDYLTYGIAFGFVCGLLYLFVPLKILLAMVLIKDPMKDPAQVVILLATVGAVTVLLVNSFADHLTANRWYFNVVWSILWYGYFGSKAVKGQDDAVHAYQETTP